MKEKSHGEKMIEEASDGSDLTSCRAEENQVLSLILVEKLLSDMNLPRLRRS